VKLITNDVSDLTALGDVAASVAAVGFLDAAHAHLTMIDVPIDRTTLLTDLSNASANFDGYLPGNVDWQLPSLADDGTAEVLGTVPIFRPTGSHNANGIFDLYLTNNTDDSLWACGRFDLAPLPMATPFNTILVTIRWRGGKLSIVDVVS
jgi:hypothetical protein